MGSCYFKQWIVLNIHHSNQHHNVCRILTISAIYQTPVAVSEILTPLHTPLLVTYGVYRRSILLHIFKFLNNVGTPPISIGT